MSHFFALLSRMKYISRWALMRNTSQENLSEHSLETAMLAHGLAVIGNVYFHKQLDAQRACLLGLYHDATEIITGDMPTPVKYHSARMRDTYKDIEREAADTLLSLLPEEMRADYAWIFREEEQDAYLRRLVKAADKISAYLKCVEEEHAGNREFESARVSTLQSLRAMALPEADYFLDHFADSYGKNLDELTLTEQNAL
ncbi:MAG: 5'-deoxynucleotidase [Clostridiales bacterium]|nr:5'-deoxynucleotidase [Clostridiales bacterium]